MEQWYEVGQSGKDFRKRTTDGFIRIVTGYKDNKRWLLEININGEEHMLNGVIRYEFTANGIDEAKKQAETLASDNFLYLSQYFKKEANKIRK